MRKYADFILSLVVLLFSISVLIATIIMGIKYNGGTLFPHVSAKEENNVTKKSKNSFTKDDETVGTIFIGDSRFVGMDDEVDIESHDREFCIAKIGQGYFWFKNNALKKCDDIRKENTALTKWRYVVCLGVNDIQNIKNYLEEYKRLTRNDETIQLILVSVNPVKDYATVNNTQIKKFNTKLQDAGYDYIDTYSQMEKNGFESTDGLHYTNKTYRMIYNLIEDGLLKLE